MMEVVREQLRDVLSATMPLTLVILGLQIFLLRSPIDDIISFLAGGVLVIAGFTLFMIGVKSGLLPIGEAIGSELPKRGSLPFIVAVTLIIGFLITVAEPSVKVLTQLLNSVEGNSIDLTLLVLVIASGVAIMIGMASLRVFYGVSIKLLLGCGYLAILILSFFVPDEFLAIAFDSGWVTTGPITVPIILGLSVGITSVLARKTSLADSFGMIGIVSIGPIIGLMLLGVFSG